MLALFGNLALPELVVIAVLAVVIFGKRLPEVAARAYANFRRLRSKLEQLRRETGIDEELRKIERSMRENSVVDLSDRTVFDPHRRPPIVPPPGGPVFPEPAAEPDVPEAPREPEPLVRDAGTPPAQSPASNGDATEESVARLDPDPDGESEKL